MKVETETFTLHFALASGKHETLDQVVTQYIQISPNAGEQHGKYPLMTSLGNNKSS